MAEEILYNSFPLTKIIPDSDLPGDLYLFTAGHFIKYRNKGDFLDNTKYEDFINKQLKFVFINAVDLPAFLEWTKKGKEKQINDTVKEIGEENRDIAVAQQEIQEEHLNFITQDPTSESVKEIVEKTRKMIGLTSKKYGTEKFLVKMRSRGKSHVDHATNVANLSLFLAIHSGYAQQVILEHIYLGALLHDYGKTKIDQELMLQGADPKAHQAAIAKHPQLGKTTLLLDSGFPDEVLRIIVEHHERNDGKGYPKGLKGTRIFDLTKIVSIANVFDNLLEKDTRNESMRNKQLAALKIISSDQGHEFDPKILAKCIRALETVV